MRPCLGLAELQAELDEQVRVVMLLPASSRAWRAILSGSRMHRIRRVWLTRPEGRLMERSLGEVRRRTDVAKRMRRRENAPYLVFKIAQRLEHSWRPLNGGLTIMTLLLDGARFVDGVYVPRTVDGSAAEPHENGSGLLAR